MGDLLRLAEYHHPNLPKKKADYMELKAAAALRQSGHKLGAELMTRFQGAEHRCALNWDDDPEAKYEGLERKRITETGAEAVALALVYETKGWKIKRRMDEGEFADWLMVDSPNNRNIALEISGCATTNRYRLARKLKQVAKCTARDAHVKAACVVEFAMPSATLAFVEG